MATTFVKNPLPPCPNTPNCIRTHHAFNFRIEHVFEALTQIFEKEAKFVELIDPKRIEIHAVYQLPIFGFKDDIDVIMEENPGVTTVFIRSSSRLGAYDFGVNKRRVKRILRKIVDKIKN